MPKRLANYVVVGELGLDGRLTPSLGVLLAAISRFFRSLELICPAAGNFSGGGSLYRCDRLFCPVLATSILRGLWRATFYFPDVRCR